MSKIVYVSNWGGHDELDRVPLRNGEYIRLTWPDGTLEEVRVCMCRSVETISDHGHPYDCVYMRAHAAILHHGVEAVVPLVGLDAERIALPAPVKGWLILERPEDRRR